MIELVEQAAAAYVEMFQSTIWADFVARGMPAEEWGSVQEAVERLQPLAAQALLASRSAPPWPMPRPVPSRLRRPVLG